MNSTRIDADRAAATAGRSLLTLYGLLVANGISGIGELRLLMEWPPGARDAYNGWLAAMIHLVDTLARAEGIRDVRSLSEADKIRLSHRAYDLLLDSPIKEVTA